MQRKIQSTKAVKIFFSYSHKDERYKKQLLAHLSPLIRQGDIESWDDRQIRAGEEWNKELLKHFNAANVILCLLSSDFIHSDYCYIVEMKRAWERRELEGIEIIPILLREVEWQVTPFSKLQIIPRDDKPIIGRSNRDKILREVAHEIAKVVDMLKDRNA